MAIATTNPATGERIQTFEPLSDSAVSARIALGYTAFCDALKDPHTVSSRRLVLLKAAQLLEEGVETYARLMTLEMGKPIQAAREEVKKCARTFRFYGEEGPAFLKAESVKLSETHEAEIHYLPIGVVLAVMPWNFPFWQVLRCAAPILLSGNSMLLKHASNVPQCALTIERLLRSAGLEEGAFQTLLISSHQVPAILRDHQVQGVTLTGSEGAGSSVAEHAGKHLKKSVLELGGSDPFIVFPSANLEKAIDSAAKARMINNGQSCIAAKRFIVHESIYERFREGMVARFKALKIGDPMDDTTELGPLASASIREDLHRLVEDAVSQGARLLMGGKKREGIGYYYEPTVLENIPIGSRIHSDEAFGPVAALYPFRTADEAFEIANQTRYGLGASVWTQELSEISRAIREVESGTVAFNGIVASDPKVPFGGVKASGYGRELGVLGAREFTNVKTIVRTVSLGSQDPSRAKSAQETGSASALSE